MIVIDEVDDVIAIRKSKASDDVVYFFVLLHNFSRRYWISTYKNTSQDSRFYEFTILLTDDMPHGEYTYIILPYDPSAEITINVNDIRQSNICVESGVGALTIRGKYLTIAGKILTISNGQSEITCGPIDILQYGLLRYNKTLQYNGYSNQREWKAYEK